MDYLRTHGDEGSSMNISDVCNITLHADWPNLCEFVLMEFEAFLYVTFSLVITLLLLLLILTITTICCCCKQRKKKKRMYVVDEEKDGGNEIPLNELRSDGGGNPNNQVTETPYDVPTETGKKRTGAEGMYDVVPDNPSHINQRLATFSSISQGGNQLTTPIPFQMPNLHLSNSSYMQSIAGAQAEMQQLPPTAPFEHRGSIRGHGSQQPTYANVPGAAGAQAELQQLPLPAPPFEDMGSIKRPPVTQVYAVIDKSKKNRGREGAAEFLISSPDDPPPSPPPPPPPPPLPVSYEQVSLRERDPPKQSDKPGSPVPGRQYHHLEHTNHPHAMPQIIPGLYDQIDDPKLKFHSSFSQSEELLSSTYLAKKYAQPSTNRTLTLMHANPEGEGGTHGTFFDPPPPPRQPPTGLESYYPQQGNDWLSATKQQSVTDF